MLQTSLPKRDYYVVSPLGRRLIGLGLGTVALSFVGVNGRDDREAAERFMDEYGEAWPCEWLKSKSVPDWAEYYNQLNSNLRRQSCVEL